MYNLQLILTFSFLIIKNVLIKHVGWTPATFKSSRSSKAAHAPAKPEDFMDESDKIQIFGSMHLFLFYYLIFVLLFIFSYFKGKELQTTSEFDLLGGTAAELQRRNAIQTLPTNSAIPGPIPDELIMPSADPVGIKLLKAMVSILYH